MLPQFAMRAARKRIYLGERRKGGFSSSRKPPRSIPLAVGFAVQTHMTMHAIAAYAQNVCFFMEAPSIGLTCDDDAPMRQTSQRKLTFPIKKPSVTCVFADHRGLCAVEWRKTYAVEPPQLDPDEQGRRCVHASMNAPPSPVHPVHAD